MFKAENMNAETIIFFILFISQVLYYITYKMSDIIERLVLSDTKYLLVDSINIMIQYCIILFSKTLKKVFMVAVDASVLIVLFIVFYLSVKRLKEIKTRVLIADEKNKLTRKDVYDAIIIIIQKIIYISFFFASVNVIVYKYLPYEFSQISQALSWESLGGTLRIGFEFFFYSFVSFLNLSGDTVTASGIIAKCVFLIMSVSSYIITAYLIGVIVSILVRFKDKTSVDTDKNSSTETKAK